MNNKLLQILFLFLALFFIADATHFRFGTISWQPTVSHNIIKFSSNYAFRITYFKSYATDIMVGELITLGTLSFGNQEYIAVTATVTAFDVVNDWFTASFTTYKEYAPLASGVKKDYVAMFTDCCRISTLINNADQYWNITTNVQLDNSVALDKVNFAPVSGMLPIYQVIYGKNNNFRIIANDPNDDNSLLRYKFSTVYFMDQPSGMTVSDSGGCFFLPTQIGLFSTQIYISDPHGAYVVVDFILQSIKQPGLCDSSCTNAGTNCDTNSQCTGCTNTGSKTIDTCVSSNLPPFFNTPPTPVTDATLSFDVDVLKTFTISCKTPYSNRTVTAQVANIPVGTTFVSTSVGQITNYTYSWTPTPNQVGSYIPSAFCVDSTGLTSTVRSFTLFVGKPECGTGNIDPKNSTGCVCKTSGYDPLTKCFDCLNRYYGPTCQPAPNCINGKVNSGIAGDGKCLCDNGWTGAACDVPYMASCSTLKSANRSVTYVNPSYINPSVVQVYLDDTPNYPVPAIISIPDKITRLDVYVLIDANPASTTTWGYIKTYMSQFQTMVENICESTQYGIGYFSDSVGGSFNFLPNLAIGSDIVVGINTYSPASYASTTTGNSLLALTSAASTPLGWNTGSFKVIVILTDSDHSSTSSSQITALTNSLVGSSVVPVVIGLNGISIPNWVSAINGQDFGTTLKASTGSDWAIQAAAGIKTILSKVVFKNKLLATGSAFVSGVPSTIALAPSTSTQQTVVGITLSKPSIIDYSINNPLATISAMGYGKVDLLINYNRPPVPTSTSISVNQNFYTFFTFAATDADMNTLTFKLTTFIDPSVGIVAWNGVSVTDFPSKTYTNQDMMVFQPATNYVLPTTIQFTVSDGCSTSSPGYFTFIVNKINQPPVCNSLSTTTNGFNKVTTFKLSGNDLEDSIVSNVISNPSALTAYGTLKYGTIDIISTTKIPSNADITFTQTVNPPTNTIVQISFKSVDSSNLVSSVCAQTINVTHTNFPPISSASTPISVIPLGSIDFTIVSTDSDFTVGDNAKFTITGKSGGGAFYLCSDSNKAPIAVNTVFNAIYDSSNGKATYVGLCFVASGQSVAIQNFATLSFTSTDAMNAVSSVFTVNVNVVGNRANAAPVVNQIPPYSCHQDYNDAPVAIVDGTDTDDSDKGNLISIITTPPTNGILYTVPAGSQTASNIANQGGAPFKVYYVPNPGFVGDDSYSYSVMDTFKVLAPTKQVTVTVLPINHKPSVVVSSSSFNSTIGKSEIGNLLTSDVDGNAVKCSVIKTPDQIQMFDSNGVQITTTPYQLSGTTYYFKLDNPSLTTPVYSSITSTFTVNCVDITTLTTPFGSLSTGDVSENVYYNYINIAPNAYPNTFECDQDSSIAFTLSGNDTETVSSSLQVKVVSLPNVGTLSVKGVILKSSDIASNLYSLNSFTYTPDVGKSNWDTINNQGPLDSFSFAVVDGKSLISNSAVVSFSVKPRNAPTYTGADTIDVLQNTRYPLVITGKIGNGGKEFNVKVIGFTNNGTLYNVFNMQAEGSMDKEILSYPNDQYGSTSYNFAYRPPTNRYGPNFDTILFQLYDGDMYSMIYTITVNVIHVNQPPTIQLISYNVLTNGITPTNEISFTDSSTVNMLINTSVIIKYIGNDIDNQIPPLDSSVPNVPLRGILYTYDPNSIGFIGTVINRTLNSVEQYSDGFWYVVYVPRKSNSGDGYARIPLDVKDEFGLVSPPVTVIINVVTVNIPPFINITKQQNYTAITNETFSIKTLTFDDPDSLYNNVSIIISIVFESTNQITPLSNVNLILSYSSLNCLSNLENATITCIGNKKSLNALISTISITSITTGNYKLVLFVDDLGYNAPQSIRSSSHLTATDNIPFTIVEPDVTTKENNNKTVLSAAIAGAAAGAAIIAAAVWKLVKKAAPPTDAFFGENGWVGDGVSQNPLYVQSTTAGTNPLYDPHIDGGN